MSPLHTHIYETKQDAILWQVDQYIDTAGDDAFKRGQAINQIAKLLACIKLITIQQMYIDAITGRTRIKAKLLNDALSQFIDSGETEGFEIATKKKFPPWINMDDIEEMGFCAVEDQGKVGFYSLSEKSAGIIQVSNFTIKPIFHVSGKAEESRHIFEVWNGVKRALMDVPSKVFVSLDTLSLHLVAEGSFIFFGTKPHLLRISSQLLPAFPLCHEIKQLGWQREGFFAFANKIYVPGEEMLEISKWGIFPFKDHHYLVPAASQVYSNNRAGDDPYKLIRVMSYQKSPITFEQWAAQMYKVYGDKGLTGIAYVFACAFRDILFKVNHNFPHLYGYGERSSGKSQWAASVCAIFYNDRSAFNVNSGTDFAFFSYMQSFINAPANLNEVDDKVLREEWFQAIKGVFDGEGRMRGKMGSAKAIEVQHVESGLILIGQYISTKDDNSLVSRSIVEPFAERQYTDDEKAEFMLLTEWQKEGITGLLTDVLQQRSVVEKEYYETYNGIVNGWRRATSREFNQRIFQNWAHLSAMWNIFEKVLKLPVKFTDFDQMCYDKAVSYSNFIRSSDTLTDFWNTVSFLLDQQQITDGWDFKIVTQTQIRLRTGDGKEYVETWQAPRKLLIIRLNNVHKLYQQAKSKAGSKDPMTLENLKHYFSSRPYYIGQIKQTQFKRYVYKTVETTGTQQPFGVTPSTTISSRQEPETTITSAFVFDYDLLGCELERSSPFIDGDLQG